MGRLAVASIRDHIKPLAEGGTDDHDNIQALCIPCHDAKTVQESARGRVGGAKLNEYSTGTRLLSRNLIGAKLSIGGVK